MNELPPGPDGLDDVDELYRRASAAATGGPDESVRRAVLAHAAQLAAERAAKRAAAAESSPARHDTTERAAHPFWWRPAIGGLAAVVLAGLLVTPLWRRSRPAEIVAPAEVQAARSGDAATAREANSGAPAAALKDLSAEQVGELPPAPPPPPASLSVPAPAPAPAPAPPPAAAAAPLEFAQDRVSPRKEAAAAAAPTMALRMAQPADPAANLRRAAATGDLQQLRGLLERYTANDAAAVGHAVIDAPDASGRTALMLATQHGQVQAVEALLQSGADPNVADAAGVTPLQVAVSSGRSDIEAKLRHAGAR